MAKCNHLTPMPSKWLKNTRYQYEHSYEQRWPVTDFRMEQENRSHRWLRRYAATFVQRTSFNLRPSCSIDFFITYILCRCGRGRFITSLKLISSAACLMSRIWVGWVMTEEVDCRSEEIISEKNDLWFQDTRRQMDEEEWPTVEERVES